jgi:SAM-dependent methyltransferase
MAVKPELNWFESWFDSPFYHILYHDRDQDEAQLFINNLLERLHLPVHSLVLDLACGKGRHSRYLNKLGYRVNGIDLSEKNIEYCKQFESDTLEFYVHDMRKIFRVNYFDIVLNLFTSFGYFEQDHQNELVVQAAAKCLNKGGYFVLDFINAHKAIQELTAEQTKTSEGITFHIRKKIENGFIIKDISFSSEGKDYEFREEVRVLFLEELHNYLIKSGLSLLEYYGDYHLNKFDAATSNRLILIARKL